MIKIENISKKFKLYKSPADRLREIISGRSYHKDYVALDTISFEVHDGETLGIIGQNGAGKSTLLKILSGIVIPDSGTVVRNGKITGLLELGTGFNFEMTGLENLYMNATLIGMTSREIDERKETIIAFSELGDFIYEPLKTYSSGMVMRLAFSIAIHANPTCFLVDEALSVGDAYFQQKCMRKIAEFRADGGSIIFVSHDMNAIAALCDYAVLIDHGKMVAYGIPRSIIDLYISRICIQSHSGDKPAALVTTTEISGNHTNISTHEVEFDSIRILDRAKKEVTHVYSEDEVIIAFSFRCLRTVEDPAFGILIRNRLGMSVFGINTHLLHQKNDPLQPGRTYRVEFQLSVPLKADDYLITVAIDNGGKAINSFDEYLLRLNDIARLKIVPRQNRPLYEGMVYLNSTITVQEIISEGAQGDPNGREFNRSRK
jgi:lipopolysaccharide transport system ATP-binding protein